MLFRRLCIPSHVLVIWWMFAAYCDHTEEGNCAVDEMYVLWTYLKNPRTLSLFGGSKDIKSSSMKKSSMSSDLKNDKLITDRKKEAVWSCIAFISVKSGEF